jgi:hypothetical protein
MKMKQSVPKRRHIKFRHREITQKKAYKNYIVCHATISSMTYDSEKNYKIHISDKYSVNVT